MRRYLVGTFIATYLSALGFGLACQTMKTGTTMHPGMYFIVWDMYCGWAAYNHNFRAVAEGVSGTFYDLNPPPWGTFRPFNTLDRFQSLMPISAQAKMTAHFAKHTKHEPIARMFVIEESWAKQFDLPEYIWKGRNAIARTPHRYTKVFLELAGDGSMMANYPLWLEAQSQRMVADNPRLQQEIRNSKPLFIVDQEEQYFNSSQQNTMEIHRSPAAN
jgi:hypothetical protein